MPDVANNRVRRVEHHSREEDEAEKPQQNEYGSASRRLHPPLLVPDWGRGIRSADVINGVATHSYGTGVRV